VLVLDEPTNDLDIETLELVESQLVDFPGTVLIVSHDRTFLNHVVTSTLVFEGGGRVEEYVGGYDEWQRQRTRQVEEARAAVPRPLQPSGSRAPYSAPTTTRRHEASQAKSLSFKERREFESLPDRIAALEAEDSRLRAAIAHPDFYKEPRAAIESTLARIDTLRIERDAAYARWDELDSRATGTARPR
jgi:ABC transport system ATP-binding/permease protein